MIRSEILQLKAYSSHPGEIPNGGVDHLDTNESALQLPLELKQKLMWLYQEHVETNRYPDGTHAELKKALGEYVGVLPQNISVGNGSDELIRSILIATCLGVGSILVAEPTFSMYGILAQTLGIPVFSVGRNPHNFAIDMAATQELSTSNEKPPLKVVFVVHPNSPTGNLLQEEEVAWLRQIPENIMVVIDEAYYEFSGHSLVSELPQHPNWVILRTFSKAFRLAAHRMGYAVAAPNIIDALEKVRLPYNLPTLSQQAALLALKHRDLLLNSIEQLQQERKRVYQALEILPIVKVWPSQANFVYLQVQNPQDLVTQLLNKAHW